MQVRFIGLSGRLGGGWGEEGGTKVTLAPEGKGVCRGEEVTAGK